MIKIKNCAIFGGTFDPIHNGHLHLIKSILDLERFERLVIVPAGDPWQKETEASSKQRLEMLELAIAGVGVEISNCELNRVGPSYAIDTVQELRDESPAEQYTWVLGSDAFAKIETWHKIDELVELVDFLVVVRPGSSSPTPSLKMRFEIIELGALDISATAIRKKVATRQSVEELVPDRVWQYIKANGLYGAA
ncbi:MAG: nicotinate-nucleotide adenylyltransferase [Actinomycetota bacterium]